MSLLQWVKRIPVASPVSVPVSDGTHTPTEPPGADAQRGAAACHDKPARQHAVASPPCSERGTTSHKQLVAGSCAAPSTGTFRKRVGVTLSASTAALTAPHAPPSTVPPGQDEHHRVRDASSSSPAHVSCFPERPPSLCSLSSNASWELACSQWRALVAAPPSPSPSPSPRSCLSHPPTSTATAVAPSFASLNTLPQDVRASASVSRPAADGQRGTHRRITSGMWDVDGTPTNSREVVGQNAAMDALYAWCVSPLATPWVFVRGPYGCGKTSLVYTVAARAGIPHVVTVDINQSQIERGAYSSSGSGSGKGVSTSSVPRVWSCNDDEGENLAPTCPQKRAPPHASAGGAGQSVRSPAVITALDAAREHVALQASGDTTFFKTRASRECDALLVIDPLEAVSPACMSALVAWCTALRGVKDGKERDKPPPPLTSTPTHVSSPSARLRVRVCVIVDNDTKFARPLLPLLHTDEHSGERRQTRAPRRGREQRVPPSPLVQLDALTTSHIRQIIARVVSQQAGCKLSERIMSRILEGACDGNARASIVRAQWIVTSARRFVNARRGMHAPDPPPPSLLFQSPPPPASAMRNGNTRAPCQGIGACSALSPPASDVADGAESEGEARDPSPMLLMPPPRIRLARALETALETDAQGWETQTATQRDNTWTHIVERSARASLLDTMRYTHWVDDMMDTLSSAMRGPLLPSSCIDKRTGGVGGEDGSVTRHARDRVQLHYDDTWIVRGALREEEGVAARVGTKRPRSQRKL